MVLQLPPLVPCLSRRPHGTLGLELSSGVRSRLLDEDADDAHEQLIPGKVALAPFPLAGAADSGVRRAYRRIRGAAAAGGTIVRHDGFERRRRRRRRRLELPGLEDGLALGRLEPGGELHARRDRVEPPVVAAALLGELARLDGRLAPRVGPVHELHHLLVLHDLVAEGEPLGRRGPEERLLLLAQDVWARGEAVCPETLDVACFGVLVG